MPHFKSSGIVTIRNLIQKQYQSLEKVILQDLEPDDRERYLTALSSSWVPLDPFPEGNNLIRATAKHLFPEDSENIRQLGNCCARLELSGIYRIFFQIPTLHFILKRSAHLWRVYYDCGWMEIEEFEKYHCCVVVHDFPQLYSDLREFFAGFLIAVVELTGKKDVRATRDDRNPLAWRWNLDWN